MDTVLAGIKWVSCLVYLDDVLVFLPTFEQHIRDIEELMRQIAKAGLKLHAWKCTLCPSETEYLSHIIMNDGHVLMDPKKTQAITNFPRPTNPAEVKLFISLAGIY